MKKKEINRKKTENLTNMWKLNNTFLDNQIIKEKKRIKSILIQVKIEIKHTKIYGTPEEVLRGKLIMISAYVKKQDLK